MHSKAVDFPKTGEPVSWNQSYQPRRWPHFMEKKRSYQSKKVLGQIFDKVSRHGYHFRPDWEKDFDQRVLTKFNLDNDLLKAARGIKSQYDTSVRRILTQYNVNTEFELWTGFAMSKPAVGTEYKRQEVLGQEYSSLKQRFRELCYEAAGGRNHDKLDPFVAAMYKITEEQIKIALFEHNQGPIDEGGYIRPARMLDAKSMPLITFPWLFPCAMIRIAQGGKYDTKNSVLTPAGGRNQSRTNQAIPGKGNTAALSVAEDSDEATLWPGRHSKDSTIVEYQPAFGRSQTTENAERALDGVHGSANPRECDPQHGAIGLCLQEIVVKEDHVSTSQSEDPTCASSEGLQPAEKAAGSMSSLHCPSTTEQRRTPPTALVVEGREAIKGTEAEEMEKVVDEGKYSENTFENVPGQLSVIENQSRVADTTGTDDEGAGSLVARLMALASED